MATKSAGRVSIRVLPDSTGFRRDLKTTLDRIEKSVKAKIPVELVLTNTALAEIKAKLESLRIKLKPDIDLHISPEQIAKLKAQIEALKPTVHVKLNTEAAAAQIEAFTRTRDMRVHLTLNEADRLRLAEATRDRDVKINAKLNPIQAMAELAWLLRPRTLHINPEISNAVLARLKGKLLAMGGLNVLGDTFRDGSDFLMNIDRMSVKLGKMATLMSGVASSIATAAGSLLVAGSDLSAIGNLGWLAPGFFTGTAIAIAISVAALKDMGEVLKDLGPRFTAFQDQISSDFWAEAEKPIRNLVDHVLPALYAMPGHKNTAQEMGKFFGEMAASIQRNLPTNLMVTMFDRLNDAIEISRGAINPFTHAFITMGEVGTRFFGRFAQWLVDLATQFDNFVTAAAGDGRMVAWIEKGIQATKDLGSLTRGIVRIFSEISDAARQAGISGLHDWAVGTNNMADALARPEFKVPLTKFFEAMSIGFSGVVLGFQKMGNGLASFMDTLKIAMGSVKSIFNSLGTYIGSILGNPQFQRGFAQLFEGIDVALLRLEPAIQPFADSLGGIGRLLGHIAASVGGLLSAVMVHWGPVLDDMGEKFETLIDPLSDMLTRTIANLTPFLKSLSINLVSPLIDLIRDSVIPLVESLATKLPGLEPLFLAIGNLITNSVAPFIDAISQVIAKIKVADLENLFRTIGGILTDTVAPLLKAMTDWLLSLDEDQISNFINGAAQTLQTIADVVKWIVEAVAAVSKVIDWIGDKLQFGLFNTDQNKKNTQDPKWVADQQKELDDLTKGWGDFWTGMNAGWADYTKWLREFDPTWLNPANWYSKLKENVPGWIDKALGLDKVKKDWKDSMDYTPKVYGTGGGTGLVMVKDLTALQQAHKTFDETIANIRNAWTTFTTWMSGGWGGFWGGLSAGWTTFSTGFGEGWNGFWGSIGTVLSDTWNGMTEWVATKSLEIATSISTFIEDTRTNWDGFWLGVGQTVTDTWNNMWAWVNQKTEEIKTNINTFASDVQTNWNNFWGSIGQTVTTKWEEFRMAIVNKYTEITRNINTFIEDTKRNMSNGWESLKQSVRDAWQSMVDTIRMWIDNAVAWIATLPGRALAALVNMPNTLRGSGRSLVDGFIDGMNDMLNNVKITARNIVQAVRNFFPFSPAKEGPFSGMGYTTFSGKALVKDFAHGMMSNMDLARDAANQIAAAASLSASLSLDADVEESGVTIDNRRVTVNNYNPVSEPSSRSITAASDLLKLKGK